jgi:hypothetical protein
MAVMMLFHVPADKDLLAAYGEVTLRHEHLNHVLRMTIKTIAGLEVDEALNATVHDSSSQLRERIRKLARQRLGEGEPLLKVQALLERCRRATDRRNDLVHSVWAKELDGEAVRRNNDLRWQRLPTVDELHSLCQEVLALTNELNQVRLEGFLHQALTKRAAP